MEKNNSKSELPVNSAFHEKRNEDDEIDLLELIGIIWVHKWWIVGITGLAAVAVIMYVIISSSTLLVNKENIKKYTSTAVVLVNEAAGAGIPFSMYEGRFDISSLLNSTSMLISYGTLAEELLNEKSMLNILANKYNLVGVNLETKYDKKSGLLRISSTSNDPVKAKEVANGAYKLIQTKFESIITYYATEERKILETRLEETRELLLDLEYKIGTFRIEHSVLDASDAELVKNLPKKEFESYLHMKFERDIQKDLLDYLPRLILFVSLKDEIESPIFQLVHESELSDEDSGISGKILISVVIMAAFFLSIMLVFILNSVKNIRSDPERMKKLKGIK